MKKLLLILSLVSVSLMAQTNYPDVNREIEKGNYAKATEMINSIICSEKLSETELYDLNFAKERMRRIRMDFKKTSDDILKYAHKYYPELTADDLKNWEEDQSLEYKIIDGEKRYFNRAHGNLFRISKEAKAKKIEIDGDKKDRPTPFLEEFLPKVVEEYRNTSESLVKPVTMQINYTLTVDADAVPTGEIVRCWMPFPNRSRERQQDVKLVSANCDNYIIAPKDIPHSSIYMEKVAKAGEPTKFNFEATLTSFNDYRKIDVASVKPYDKSSGLYQEYTSERAPHIIFTDRVKELSAKIVGDETNPYLKAKKIYKWINDNIPWAGAREYSTIENISDYCLSTGHGDCGIQTLTFTTLCRYNGIPAKWQSGWMLYPTITNLHDWGEIYLEGYGWVPVDQSFGLTESDDEDVHWFFFGGNDAYHFIVNDDFSRPFYPAKIFPRSETVDFQRGEVEWRGGNLYFDKWDYHMDVEFIQ